MKVEGDMFILEQSWQISSDQSTEKVDVNGQVVCSTHVWFIQQALGANAGVCTHQCTEALCQQNTLCKKKPLSDLLIFCSII